MALDERYRNYGSAAVDLYSVRNSTVRPLELPENLPHAPAEKAKIVKFRLKISPFAVVGTMLCVVLLLLVVFSYVSLFEVRNEIGDLESAKSDLLTDREKLRSEYESSIDLSVIEERALALGMTQASGDNIRYVQIGSGDSTEVFSAPKERNILEQIYDAFYGVFRSVGEYFS